MDLADISQKDKDSLRCSTSGDQHSISASTGTKGDLTKKLLSDVYTYL